MKLVDLTAEAIRSIVGIACPDSDYEEKLKPLMLRPGAFAAVLLMTSCHGPSSSYLAHSPEKDRAAATRGLPDEDELRVEWSDNTRSPNPRPPHEIFSELEALCGEPDERLDRAARSIGRHVPLGENENDVDRLTFALRAAGTPYVRPLTWSGSWNKSDPVPLEELKAQVRQWLSRVEPNERLRCGLAETTFAERQRLVLVAAEAPAELSVPLPTTARLGQWLTFEADLTSEAENGRVILLGPQGEPQVIPTSQQGNRIRARFAAASPGQWQVQLLASTQTGPRPMLEATLYVEEPPERVFVDRACPGETAAPPNRSPAEALELMVAATRAETGRPPLRRDVQLDALALNHALVMRRAGKVGHDLGDGSPSARLLRAGLHSKLAGENVVSAADPLRAHRALWASPSHRMNLLHRGFTRWGLGVVSDTNGALWVCELFTSGD
jgi:uncharacterized protein YkwD